jgi:tRNA 2-thiouridine synthesizing protein A
MSLVNLQIDKMIDISGKICPYTVMETRDTLKTMESGELLEVISDYKPAAIESIPNFCRKKNYPIEVIDNGDGNYRLLIKKEE